MKILLLVLAKPLVPVFVAASYFFGYKTSVQELEFQEAARDELELHLLEREAKEDAKLNLPEVDPAPEKKDAPPAPPADPSAP